MAIPCQLLKLRKGVTTNCTSEISTDGSAELSRSLKMGLIMEKELIRNNIEWKPITGFEDQYEVSNYGDFHILPYEFIDKAIFQ